MVKRVKDQSTEEKILAAARNIFISRGMAGARMQDIADEAGINKAMLHYYFKNKEQLFENIFTKLTHGFWQQLTSIFEADTPLFEKIENFCSVYIDKILENPYIPMFILHEMSQRPAGFVKTLVRSKAPRPGKLLIQIQEEVKKGNIQPIDPTQLIMNMISMCIFPFIGKPMFMTVMNIDETSYRNLIQHRKKEIPRFIINSIKK